MNQKSVKRWMVVNALLVLLLVPALVFTFQNCSPKSFSTGDSDSSGGSGTPLGSPTPTGSGTPTVTPSTTPSLSPTPTPTPGSILSLKDQIILTQKGVAKSWDADSTGDRTGYVLSLNASSTVTSLTLTGVGSVDITDSTLWKLKFTPLPNFVGNKTFTLYAFNSTLSRTVSATITLQVGGSAVNLLQPALAVRATGCVVCHADVQSSIITDFGAGNPYYFGISKSDGTNWDWNYDIAYGDQHAFYKSDPGAWASLLLRNSGLQISSVIVPKTSSIPSEAATLTGENTLGGYLQHRLKNSSYSESKDKKVVVQNQVYIGAPTADRIKTVFGYSGDASKMKYLASAGGVAYSGLTLNSAKNYFTNSGTLKCEGDLLLDGSVYLNNLSVDSKTGCRIYATKSVFIYGPINYVTGAGDYSLRNLQITSASAILMGMGSLFNGSNHCESASSRTVPTGTSPVTPSYRSLWDARDYYCKSMTAAQCTDFKDGIADSAKYRLQYHWGAKGFFFRNYAGAGDDYTNAVYNEMVNSIGIQKDASCESSGRNVGYERLLLNAPLIESRYAGDFSGSIIAEVALMALGLDQNQGHFVFKFDSVFKSAEILPLLQEQDFLRVQ